MITHKDEIDWKRIRRTIEAIFGIVMFVLVMLASSLIVAQYYWPVWFPDSPISQQAQVRPQTYQSACPNAPEAQCEYRVSPL